MSAEAVTIEPSKADDLLHRVTLQLESPAITEARLGHLSLDTNAGTPFVLLYLSTNNQAVIENMRQSSDRFDGGPTRYTGWSEFVEGAVAMEIRKESTDPFSVVSGFTYALPGPVVAIQALRTIISTMPDEMRIMRLGGPNNGSAMGFYNPWTHTETRFWSIDAQAVETPQVDEYLNRHNAVRRDHDKTASVRYYSLLSDGSGAPGTRFVYRTDLDIY